ncbi:hypothetical protein RSAG8_03059, partial [Rhizoctonia solani AG-8 WAC10335]
MSHPQSSAIAKRASRLSINAHPVSPVIATTSLSLDDSEEDIDIQPQLPEPRHVEPGIRLSFAIFGLGSLMPWNAMITAMPYFLARLSGSPYASSFPSWLSVTWTFVGFISL